MRRERGASSPSFPSKRYGGYKLNQLLLLLLLLPAPSCHKHTHTTSVSCSSTLEIVQKDYFGVACYSSNMYVWRRRRNEFKRLTSQLLCKFLKSTGLTAIFSDLCRWQGKRIESEDECFGRDFGIKLSAECGKSGPDKEHWTAPAGYSHRLCWISIKLCQDSNQCYTRWYIMNLFFNLLLSDSYQCNQQSRRHLSNRAPRQKTAVSEQVAQGLLSDFLMNG